MYVQFLDITDVKLNVLQKYLSIGRKSKILYGSIECLNSSVDDENESHMSKLRHSFHSNNNTCYHH